MAARPTILQLVREQRHALDELETELEEGIRSAVHYDELEAKARGISRGVVDAFRKGRP